jgi:hypothetical protein
LFPQGVKTTPRFLCLHALSLFLSLPLLLLLVVVVLFPFCCHHILFATIHFWKWYMRASFVRERALIIFFFFFFGGWRAKRMRE